MKRTALRVQSFWSWLFGLNAIVLACACGARTELLLSEAPDAAAAAISVDSAKPPPAETSDQPEPVEASTPPEKPNEASAPPRCTNLSTATGGGSGPDPQGPPPIAIAPGPCSVDFIGRCNGVTYQVSCGCPDSDCACFGQSTHVVRYTGCPYCTIDAGEAFALCGFLP